MDWIHGRRSFLKAASAFGVGTLCPGLMASALGEDRMIMQKEKRCGLVSDARCKLHETGPGQPESPDRFDAVAGGLKAAGLMEVLVAIPSREAEMEEVLRVHSRGYYETVFREVAEGRGLLSTGDTILSPDSLLAANLAAGGALNAVDAVCNGEVLRAFCNIRPPGHHATPDRGMGFCLWNHVAMAARHAQAKHGIERVLIVDWDVHHGNGTQDVFYADESVFFFSTHQSPWYPGTGAASETGAGKGKGSTMNCPFPAGSGRQEILGVMEQKLVPAMKEFRPGLILISAGFDSRRGDPLGRFMLEDGDFTEMTRLLVGLAGEYAEGKVISLLEGGYNLTGLASAAAAHVEVLSEEVV